MTTLRVQAMRKASPVESRGFLFNAAALWLVVVGLAVLEVCALPLAGFRLSTAGLLNYNVVFGFVLLPFALFYTFFRFDKTAASILGSLAIVLLLAPLLCLYTYIMTALSGPFPLRDAALAAFDESLGFSWPSHLAWCDAHPGLVRLGRFAYLSIFDQAAVAVFALSILRQCERLQTLIYAFVLGALICGAVACLVPALGAYSYYAITAPMHEHIQLMTKDLPSGDVLSLRAGRFAAFSLADADGIVSFPSFHTTLGLLFAWAFWKTSYLRWCALALNAMLLAATPLQGSHYIADVLAGFLVAAVAIWGASRLRVRVASFRTADSERPRGSLGDLAAPA